MPFFLAGLSSLTFGVADFFGGLATRRASALSVVFLSQLVGGGGILLAAALLDPIAGGTDFAWGAAAGVAGAIGLTLLYHGLATMRIGVVALVTAIVGTTTPVVFGVAVGERPSVIAWVGIAISAMAIILIAGSSESDEDDDARGGGAAILLATTAGIAFGLFGIFISRTAEDSGLWPLVGSRAASILLVFVIVLATRGTLFPPAGRGHSAMAGALDMAANVLFLLAVRQELLSLVTVIMAMYPASTITLARVVLDERIRRRQAMGLTVGAVGVALIVLG